MGDVVRRLTQEVDDDDAETLTSCPACNGKGVWRCPTCGGTGLASIVPEPQFGPSVYRWVACPVCREGDVTCPHCRGSRLVSASRASGFRRKLDPATDDPGRRKE